MTPQTKIPIKENNLSFGEHCEELRRAVLRCLVVWGIVAISLFCFRDLLFSIVFAPAKSNFCTYQFLHHLADRCGLGDVATQTSDILFINFNLTRPLVAHIQVAMAGALLLTTPFIVAQCFRFIAPAIHKGKRLYSAFVLCIAILLFYIGGAVAYFVVFPFAFRFLALYQIEEVVFNQIALDSYLSMILTLTLLMGLCFEIPMALYILSKIGIVDRTWLIRYRKHAVVVICIIAALITPTTDVFTMLLVIIPFYLLYEASILIIRKSTR